MTQQQNTPRSTEISTASNHCRILKQELEAKADRLRKDALIDAETLSQTEHQMTLQELKVRSEEFRQQYRQLRVSIEIALNPKTQGHLGNDDALDYAHQLDELSMKVGEVRKEIEAHPAKNLERPTLLTTYERVLLVAPFIILGLDLLFEAPALRILGGSGLLAYGTAILLNGCKYFFSKFLNNRIRQAETKRERTTWFAIGLIAFGAVALMLGVSRHAYLQMQDGGSLYGPVILAALSFFFSVAAWIAEYFGEDVREKQALITEQSKAFLELDALENEKRNTENRIQQVKNERSERLGSRLITMDNARSLEQFLEDHYRGTVSKFQTVYHSRSNYRNNKAPVFLTDVPALSDEVHTDYYQLNDQQP